MAAFKGYPSTVNFETQFDAGVDVTSALNAFELYDPSIKMAYGNGFEHTLFTRAPESNNQTRDVIGYRATSYASDYYERIHITPSRFDLGNLLSEQVRSVNVWNAFLDAKNLIEIAEVATGGITLTAPIPTPTIFQGLEDRTYTLNISDQGPAIINAQYIFNFDGAEAVLAITGRRVVVWPYIPQDTFTEVVEWKTDVINTYTSEQRFALRTTPRQMLEYDYLMENTDLASADVMLRNWSFRVFGVPVWREMQLMGAVASGGMSLAVDTRYCDYREGDVAIIFQDVNTFEIIELTTITDTALNFKYPIGADYQHAYVMPLRFGRMLSSPKFNRTLFDVSKATASFTITDSVDLANLQGPEYLGLQILDQPSLLSGSFTQTVFRDVSTIDNDISGITVDIDKDHASFTQPYSFRIDTAEEMWYWRQWLHGHYGKLKPFWVPTWNNDMVLKESVAAGSQSFTIKYIGMSQFFNERYFMLKVVGRDAIYGKITGCSLLSNGDESLSIAASTGFSFAPSDVEICCFINPMRMNSDRIEISHLPGNHSTLTVPLTGVSHNEFS